MRMVTAIGLILFASFVASASPQDKSACPQVTIVSTLDPDEDVEFRTFTAQLVGTIPGRQVYFHWTSTWGAVTSGQGTLAVVLKVSKFQAQNPAVYLNVVGEGIPKGCSVSDYRMIGAKSDMGFPYFFDGFGEVPEDWEQLRLRNFAAELGKDPDARAYIVINGRIGRDPTELTQRLDRIKWFLLDQCGVAADRIRTSERAADEHQWVKLFVLPKESSAKDVNENW